MKNKSFVIVIVIIGLLIGCIVWQQVNIMGIKSQLINSEAPAGNVQSALTGVAEVKSTLASLAEIELGLAVNEKLQQVTQNLMLMYRADSQYYLAIYDLDQAESSLNQSKEKSDFLISLFDEHDELMAQKIALLQGQ